MQRLNAISESTDKNKAPGIASSNALLVQRLRIFSTALVRLTPSQCRLLFNAVKRPKSSLHIAKERINQMMSNPTYACFIRAKQEHDTGYAQAFCGLVQQQGGIPTVGQNSRHEIKGIKSVFQTAQRFRAYTTRPYMNVLKTIGDLKRPLQNTSLHLFVDSRNPKTGFRLFSPPIPPNFTQIPP